MAFIDKGKLQGKSTSKLAIGESIEGYVIGFRESRDYDQTNILMRDKESGEEFLLYTSGNLKWFVADGKVELGEYTKITKTADPSGKGKNLKGAVYELLQDPDDTVEVSKTETMKQARSTNTNDDIKARAQQVMEQAKG